MFSVVCVVFFFAKTVGVLSFMHPCLAKSASTKASAQGVAAIGVQKLAVVPCLCACAASPHAASCAERDGMLGGQF